MPTFSMGRITALLALATLTTGAAQDVVFRTGVDLVTVDVTVAGSDGRPLKELGPSDFVLKVDGKARPLASVEYIEHALSTAREKLSIGARHFTTNEDIEAGRLVVVAVDQSHIRRLEGRQALTAAARFIEALDPLDRIAVVPLSRPGTVSFTRDRASLTRRLETIVGQGDQVFLQFNIGLAEAIEIADGGRVRLAEVVQRECGRSLTEYINPNRAADDAIGGRDACPEQVEQESRALSQQARTQANISISALQALISALKPLDGPKTVVLLSEGIVLDPRLVDTSELAAAAHDARVAIHALHIEVPLFEPSQDRVSPTLLRDISLGGDGLSRLTGATRGAVYRLVGSDPAPFARITRELSAYYLLAFEAGDRDRDGKIHRIEVSLAKRRATLRARPAFRLPVIRPSAALQQEDLSLLLRGIEPATELPVRVATYSYPEPTSDNLRLVVSTETEDRSRANVLMGYVLIDARGVIVASGAQAAPSGRHAFSTVVPPGTYTLRVAGIDPLGRRGRVERAFAAHIERGPEIRTSDLILAPVPARASDPLHPIIDHVAVTRLVAYLEVQAFDPLRLDGAEVHVEIADATGTVRASSRGTVASQDGAWGVARLEIPIVRLAPGRFVAEARIVAGTREIGRISRPFTYDP